MKTIGVVIDDWKLSIFKHHLDEAGYKFTFHKGISFGTLIIRVQAKFASDIAPIVEKANAGCEIAKNAMNKGDRTLMLLATRRSKLLGGFSLRKEMKKP